MAATSNVKKNKGARGLKTLCLSSMLALSTLVFTPVAYAQSNDVLNRLNRLENELDTLNRAVYRGEMPPASATSRVPPVYNTPSTAGSVPNGEVRMQELETQIRDLTGKLEEQRYEIDQLKRKLERFDQASQASVVQDKTAQFATPKTAVRAMNPGVSVLDNKPSMGMNIATPKAKEDAGANQIVTTDTTLGGAKEPTQQYEQAFADLKAENYAAAQKGFEGFLSNYKDHSLASNTKYWLGETYYVRGQFDQAAKTFAEGYRSYPDSSKAPDNLLKLGLSLAGMGKKDDACVALAQLPLKHADGSGPVLRRGEQERERLACQ